MGKTLMIDTTDLKQIAASNVTILQSTIQLTKLAEQINDASLSQDVREALEKLLASAEKIQESVGATLKAS
jgi:hypothetical protein